MSRGGNTLKKPESQTEFKTTRSFIQEVSTVPEICETLGNCDGSTKVNVYRTHVVYRKAHLTLHVGIVKI